MTEESSQPRGPDTQLIREDILARSGIAAESGRTVVRLLMASNGGAAAAIIALSGDDASVERTSVAFFAVGVTCAVLVSMCAFVGGESTYASAWNKQDMERGELSPSTARPYIERLDRMANLAELAMKALAVLSLLSFAMGAVCFVTSAP